MFYVVKQGHVWGYGGWDTTDRLFDSRSSAARVASVVRGDVSAPYLYGWFVASVVCNVLLVLLVLCLMA